MKNSIVVQPIFLEKINKTCRISADVNNEILWFESNDILLRRSPEAFANALLVPAMMQGFDLEFFDPLCPEWIKNADKLMAIYNDWYGWKIISIQSPIAEPGNVHDGKNLALCFSAGVDSFHSLLTYPEKPSYLVMVHGYDIALHDIKGAEIVYDHIKVIASEVDIDAVKVTTNYRQHSIAGRKYRYSYEGALAAIGNLMSGVNELVISSDYSRAALQQFNAASHWRTAPLRSSQGLKITHFGDAFTRDEKLRQIGSEPLLKNHLRVCQENLKPEFSLSSSKLNCGKCDKCIRTIIPMMQTRNLGGVTVFESTDNIAGKIDAINFVPKYACITYAKFLALGLDREIARSIEALIVRSKFVHGHTRLSRWGAKLITGGFRAVHWLAMSYKRIFQE